MKQQYGLWVFCFSAAFLVLFSGCSEEYDYQTVPVTDSTLVYQEELKAEFLVFGEWGNTGGRFSECRISESEESIDIYLVGKSPRSGLQRPAVIEFSGTFEIEVESPGEYTFRFMRGADLPLVKVVVFQ